MLRLNLSAENERELASSLMSNDQRGILPDFEMEQLGAEWTRLAIDRLTVDYERVYRQSVGAFVIVQSGSREEKDAWDAALESTRAQILESVRLSVESELKHIREEAE